MGLGVEMGSMMITEQIINLVFDQQLKEYSPKDLATMVGMILGLRGVHAFKGDIKVKDIKKDTAGKVIDIVVVEDNVDVSLNEIRQKYKDNLAEFKKTEQWNNRKSWKLERYDAEMKQREEQMETNKKLGTSSHNEFIQKEIDLLKKQRELRKNMGDAIVDFKETSRKGRKNEVKAEADSPEENAIKVKLDEIRKRYKDARADFDKTEQAKNRKSRKIERFDSEIQQRADQMDLNNKNPMLNDFQKNDINSNIQKDIDLLKQQRELRKTMDEAISEFKNTAKNSTKSTLQQAAASANPIDEANYKNYSPIEQQKLDDHMRWQEKQSLYATHLTEAQTLINNPEYKDSVTDAMRAITTATDIREL